VGDGRGTRPAKHRPQGGGSYKNQKLLLNPNQIQTATVFLACGSGFISKKSPHKAGFGFSAERLDQRCTSRRTEPVNN
jgi:hypothetical protein